MAGRRLSEERAGCPLADPSTPPSASLGTRLGAGARGSDPLPPRETEKVLLLPALERELLVSEFALGVRASAAILPLRKKVGTKILPDAWHQGRSGGKGLVRTSLFRQL